MTEGKGLRREATSPHVSLRQAARPVIVAYGILSGEREAAGALAEESRALLDATTDVLLKLGLVHVLTGGVDKADPGDEHNDQTQRLVEAYARTGMAWAKVMSSVMRLAELLIDGGDWAAARLLADLVKESGEAKVAEHVERLLSDARKREFDTQLAAIKVHGAMTQPELREAVTKLNALDQSFREKSDAIRAWRLPLADSAHKIAYGSRNPAATAIAGDMSSRAKTLLANPILEDDYQYKLPIDELLTRILGILQVVEG